MSSVFTTPLLAPALRSLARVGLRATGWKILVADLPRPPFVFIGAPHTSNWDFPLLLAAILVLRLDARWLGKDTLFRAPFGGLMRWLGGIPVDRSQPQNLVASTARLLQQHPELVVCIPPEGTRRRVERWRTGFYYIAAEAGVPIQMTVIDGEARCIRLLGTWHPGGDADREIREIQRLYRGFRGLIPENTFELPE
ncbi:MAG: 1-acyl-sn-glycerol-3-phosphate acyltransferase [Pseudohongiellaceae bacterium]|jgi:1-acyl-sn-glycerol-3-phosphate acyltransferase